LIIPTRVTAPAVEPVTLSEIKTHLRGINHLEHETLLRNLIESARQQVEAQTGRALVQRQVIAYFEGWPDSNVFELPFPKLQSVTTVKYTGTDGTQSTFSTDNYSVDIDSEPGRVVLGYSKTWPSTTLHELDNPIEITYLCGYAPTADSPADYVANIPESIKTAMKFIVELNYDRPPDGYAKTLENAVDALLAVYKVWGF